MTSQGSGHIGQHGQSHAQADDHHHDHHHIPADSNGMRLAIALVIIAVFMVIEIIGGIISGSLALLADAGHMATDAAALMLALSARWLAQRKARTDVFPYGLRRAQVLAGFLNAITLIGLTGWLLWEAVQRFFQPQPILSGFMLAVAVAGLIANIAAFAVLHGGSRHDLNLRGALLHVVGDIFGSIAAIASALIIAYTGFVRIDPILTLIVCGLILRAAWPLLSEASHILLQGAPATVKSEEIVAALKARVPGIADVHQLKIWMLTPEELQLAMHIDIKDPARAQEILTEVKKILHQEFSIAQSTIQIECEDCPDRFVADDRAPDQRPSTAKSSAPASEGEGSETRHSAPSPVMRIG